MLEIEPTEPVQRPTAGRDRPARRGSARRRAGARGRGPRGPRRGDLHDRLRRRFRRRLRPLRGRGRARARRLRREARKARTLPGPAAAPLGAAAVQACCPFEQQLHMLLAHALMPQRLDDQRRRRPARGPLVAGLVDVVVDPGQRALAGVVGDRVDLPVGRRRPRRGRRRSGTAGGRAGRAGGGGSRSPSPPSRWPRSARSAPPSRSRRRAALGGYVVHDAVDRVQPARRALGERRIARCEPVALPEAEQADHAVDIDEQQGFVAILLHMPLARSCATRVRYRCYGYPSACTPTLVESCRCLVKLEGYEVEI